MYFLMMPKSYILNTASSHIKCFRLKTIQRVQSDIFVDITFIHIYSIYKQYAQICTNKVCVSTYNEQAYNKYYESLIYYQTLNICC